MKDEYNRVINHAIEQGIEASVFLHCWRAGDWSGCAEFGFEPNMAAYTAPQPAKQPLLADEICDSWEFITGHHRIQFGPNSEGRYVYLSPDEVIAFARAIERAHGIGGQT